MLYACKRCMKFMQEVEQSKGRRPQRTYIHIICQKITATTFRFFFRCNAYERMDLVFGVFPISTGDQKISRSFHSFLLLRSIKSTLRMLVIFSFCFLLSILTTTTKKKQ